MKRTSSEKYLSDFQKLSSAKKIAICLVLLIVLCIGIFTPKLISLLPPPKNNVPVENQLPKPPTSHQPASLKLISKSPSYRTGDTINIDMILDSGTNEVGAADFVITFDPETLKALSVNQGNFFKSLPLKKIDAGSIKLSGIAEITDNQVIFPRGVGNVATISFKALKPNSYALISFDKEKTIVASDGRNILESWKDLYLTIYE